LGCSKMGSFAERGDVHGEEFEVTRLHNLGREQTRSMLMYDN